MFKSTLVAACMLMALPAYAGNLTNITYTTEAPNYTPVRKPAGTHTAWICQTQIGWCYYTYPAYIGAPCECCGPFGCTPGAVTAFSSLKQHLASLPLGK